MQTLDAVHGILALAGLGSLRLFLPPFLLSLILHLHRVHGWWNLESIRELAQAAPTWFTHPLTVGVLGLLALAELLAQRDPDLRQFLHEDLVLWCRPLMTALLVFGFLSPAQAQEARTWGGALGYGVPLLGTTAAGGLTLFLASAQAGLHRTLASLDEDDDLGLQTLLNWAQESFVVLMVVLSLFSLFLGGILVLGGLVALVGVSRLLARYEARRVHACPACGTQGIPNAAPACRKCGAPQEAVGSLGILGQTTTHRVLGEALEDHRWTLLEHRRCPGCASPIPPGFHSPCAACGRSLWENAWSPRAYLARVEGRTGWALQALVCLVPVLGWITISLWNQVRLIRPLRAHLGWERRFLDRYLAALVRLPLRLLLLFLSAVPGVSALLVVIAWARYRACRRMFLREAVAAPRRSPPS